MARSLRKISKYFKRQVEARFNPLFKSNIQCGVIVDIDKVFDIDYVDTLSSFGVNLPTANDANASLPELSSMRKLKLAGKAKASIPAAVPIDADISAALKSARNISMSFGEAKTSYLKRYPLEVAIREALGGNAGEDLASYLAHSDHHIVVATYSAKARVHFAVSGDGNVDFKAKAPNVGSGDASIAWEWKDEATLESTTPVIFGFETCDWRRKARRLKESS
jgi:hypothetical protein